MLSKKKKYAVIKHASNLLEEKLTFARTLHENNINILVPSIMSYLRFVQVVKRSMYSRKVKAHVYMRVL